MLHSPQEVERLDQPDPRKHGLLPFVIKRLQHLQPEIEKMGHKVRFAVARGPLNIASFLIARQLREGERAVPGGDLRIGDVLRRSGVAIILEWQTYVALGDARADFFRRGPGRPVAELLRLFLARLLLRVRDGKPAGSQERSQPGSDNTSVPSHICLNRSVLLRVVLTAWIMLQAR